MTKMDRQTKAYRVHSPPRDLIDFYVRWQSFRPQMIALLSKDLLSDDEARTLRWLVALADRIREEDLSASTPDPRPEQDAPDQ